MEKNRGPKSRWTVPLKSNDITNVKQYIIFTLFIQICCFNNFYVKIYSFYIFCIGFILVLFSSSGSGSRWSPYTFYVTLPSPKKSESLHLWLSRLEEMHRNMSGFWANADRYRCIHAPSVIGSVFTRRLRFFWGTHGGF